MKYALPFILLTLLFSATTSAAVIKLDIRDGQLHGASNIGIDGTLYDVEFFEGTCEDVFSGCTTTSNLLFNSLELAKKATQTIIDLLFVDSSSGQFGNMPYLTFGCDDSANQCSVDTPYKVEIDNNGFAIAFFASATNFNENVGSTRLTETSYPSYFDTSTFSHRVLAKWSLADSQPSNSIPTVSEPSAILLFALPLMFAFGGNLRRRVKE